MPHLHKAPSLCVTLQADLMEIELIPVIEIVYNNQKRNLPTFPYWEHSEIWDSFNQENLLEAGFTDKLTPFLSGSSFYRLADISNKNLSKLTIDQTTDLQNGKYTREEAISIYGGYVLRIDGQDIFFPQCCGELSDITYWTKLSIGQDSFCEGHPRPEVKFKKGIITLDFTVDKYDEPFQPPVLETTLKIERKSLGKAIEKVKLELEIFGQRLLKINIDEELNIPDIDKMLIWNNPNYE